MQWTTIYIDDSTNECYFCTFFRNAKYFMANFRNVIIYITTNITTTGSQPRSLWSVADIKLKTDIFFHRDTDSFVCFYEYVISGKLVSKKGHKIQKGYILLAVCKI